jgi:type IV pilus assembly protein PilA
MVVVVIIGILVAIAIPIYNAVQANAQESAHAANVRTLRGIAAMWIAENPGKAVTAANDETELAPFIDEWPIVPRVGSRYDVTIDIDGTITVLPATLITP